MQSEHEPGVSLWKSKVSIELGEKSRVGEIVVALGPGLFEGAAGEVSHWIVHTGDGEGRQVGGAIGDHATGKGPGELLPNEGFGGAHFGGP